LSAAPAAAQPAGLDEQIAQAMEVEATMKAEFEAAMQRMWTAKANVHQLATQKGTSTAKAPSKHPHV
jgi:hypothetical protein